MKQEVIRLLAEMFKSYGYETGEGTFCDIVGKRQDYEIWVKCDIEGNLNTLERFTQQANGKNSLYVTTKKIKGGEETVRRYANDTGVIIWDRDTLARNVGAFMVENLSRETLESVVGNYCLESLLDQKKNFDPVSVFANSKNPVSGVLPEFYQPVDMESMRNRPINRNQTQSSDLTDLFDTYDEKEYSPFSGASADRKPEQRQSEYIEAPTPLPQSHDIPEPIPGKFHAGRKETLGIHSSKINMPIERAEAAGKASFGEVRDISLKFVPYWQYSYTLQVDRKIGNDQVKMSASGEGLVNAVNGLEDNIELGDVGTQTEIPDIEYVMKQPQVTKEEAQKAILERLKKTHTKEIKSNDMDAQSIIYQNKVFRPQEKDFSIKITQVFASIWEVQGKKACLEINAYNGQQLSNPADDGAEFV